MVVGGKRLPKCQQGREVLMKAQKNRGKKDVFMWPGFPHRLTWASSLLFIPFLLATQYTAII